MELNYMTVLWGIVSFSGLKILFLCTFSHATSGSSRPNCSFHSCNCKTSLNQPSISLVTPSFDWNTTEQYDDFQLFCKSVESWLTLQNIPAETPEDPTVEPNSTQLEYVLNFLGNTGRRSLTIGSQLAQLMRLQGRRSELQPSWTTCHQQWTTQYHNAAESTNWKSHQMNLLTVSELLLIDVTSQQKMRRNRTLSTDS